MSAPDGLDQIVAALGFLPSLLSHQRELYRWQVQLLLVILALRLVYARVRDPILEIRLQVEQMERPRFHDLRAWIRRVCRLRSPPPAALQPAARVSAAEHLRVQSATTVAALAALRLDPRYRFRMAEIEADPVSTSGGNWQHGRFAHVNLLEDPAFDEAPARDTEAQRNRACMVTHLKWTLCEWISVFLLGQLVSALGFSSRTIRVPVVAGLVLLLFPLGPMVWRRCFTPPMYRSNAARFRAPSAPMWRRVLALLIDRAPILIHAAPSRVGKTTGLMGQLSLAALTLCVQALMCFFGHASLGARLLDLQFVRMPSGEVDRRWVVLVAWLWMDVLWFRCACLRASEHAVLFASILLCSAELGFLLVKRRSLMESCCSNKAIVGATPAADDPDRYDDDDD